MNLRNFPPVYCPVWVVEDFPKAALADAAYNLAMRLSADNHEEALTLLTVEASRSKAEARAKEKAEKEGK